MRQQSNPALFNALVGALPLAFLENLATALSRVHAEAVATATESPLLEETEAWYLVPHLRRAFFEKQFRDSARSAGLVAKVKSTRGDTAHFSVVEASQFVITASFIAERGGIPRAAQFRSDLSTLNDLLEQGQLFTIEQAPVPDALLASSDDVYCILAYGGGTKRSKLFMQFVFPAPGEGGSVDRYEFTDVLEAARAAHQPESGIVDKAFPTPKKRPDSGTGTNDRQP